MGHAFDKECFDASALAANQSDVARCRVEGARKEFRDRRVGSTVDGWCVDFHLEQFITDADDCGATGPRSGSNEDVDSARDGTPPQAVVLVGHHADASDSPCSELSHLFAILTTWRSA